ncbi:MAG: hypothetical protein QHH19_04355 [Candidatus Thermoplasmatota archaeon]|jgi:hypothetical protein|nr:hypothetical protein [Candidatus Thermoplasmatota archaeon]
MEKKIIFLELPLEMVEKIDEQNIMGDRSAFVSDLLEKQLQHDLSKMEITKEIQLIKEVEPFEGKPGDIRLVNNRGITLGTFNINTTEGFRKLADKIHEISRDPIVRMRVRRWK